MDSKVIKDIVGDLDLGMKCFIHTVTREVLVIPDTDRYAGADLDPWSDLIEEIEKNVDDYIEIEGMDSRQSFVVMRAFIDTVDNKRLSEKLMDAVSGRKPFKNFKLIIDNSGGYRERWFSFKEQALTEWVERQVNARNL